MSTTRPSALLRRYGLRPDKAFGQHFLINAAVADRIVDAAAVAGAIVLEIGAGTGTLTRRLARKARRVVAVEIDGALAHALQQELTACDELTLMQRDILDVDFTAPCREYGVADLIVVGNLPYNITGPVIERFLTYRPVIRRAVVMVQEEVGRRLCAPPGCKAYGAVSVLLRYAYDARILFRVAPGNFHPRPEVQSVVMRLHPYPSPPVTVEDETLFRRLVKAAFRHRRKMLHHAVAQLTDHPTGAIASRSGIDLRRRGETLSLEEFAGLANVIRRMRP